MHRRTILVTAAGAAAGTLLTACTGDTNPAAWSSPNASGTPQPDGSPAPGSTAVTIEPKHGTANFAVNKPVVVTAVNGTLKEVTVTSGGNAVAGALDAAQQTWTSTGALA